MNFTNLKNFIDTLPAYGIPSSDVIVYRDHKEIWRHAVGEPLRGDELYNTYSCSKIVTCLAALLSSREWLLGSDPEFTDEIKYRTDEGEFTLHLTVKGEIVTDCTVYTDSLEPTAADKIRNEVIGKNVDQIQN